MLALMIMGATWFLVNTRDEELSPHVRTVLDAKHDTVAPEDNLFFAILAFDSQNDADVNKQGQDLHANYLKARQANVDVTFNFDKIATFARQPFDGNKEALCGRAKQHEDCVERAIAHPEVLQKLVADNRLLLNRYKNAATYAHLQNPIALTFDTPVASWAPFMLAKRLFLTDAALEISRGRIDAGIAQLRSEFAFTRHILAEPDILLIDKMILAASARASVSFISDLLRSRSLSDAQYIELNAIITPLSDDERSLSSVFAREFTAFAAEIRELSDPKNASRRTASNGDKQPTNASQGYWASHFIKVNATLNFAWSFVEDKQRASQASCTNYLANQTEMEKRFALVATDYIYNPVGKILGKVAAPGGLEYIQSMCDLEGMYRIVALQILVRSRHTSDEDIADFVRHAGPQYANPFTGQPMQLDAGKHNIAFRPVAPRDANYFPWPI